ncbi:MAG: pirin family protein [Rikenellaceae bacterium]|jgi:redox-sensitive bicupin YhaK (pirin superfamily)|nr:pirin family protein [Rikenellaceae bacterium]
MTTIFHPASERGHVDHGWLDTHHSFSFAGWYDPQKVHFGALRVLNDDIVLVGEGFGTHPHENMEIVSIPLSGSLAHRDSTGSAGTIHVDEVQIMSAGTGIRHSEYNGSPDEVVNFLQIWVFPRVNNIKPRYDQKRFDPALRQNRWQVLVSPDERDGALWINQDALFSRVRLEAGRSIDYECRIPDHMVYLFLIEGLVEIGKQRLARRDAIGVSDANRFTIKAVETSDLLAIEIP